VPTSGLLPELPHSTSLQYKLLTYTEKRTVSAVAHNWMASGRCFWCSAYWPSQACTALAGLCVWRTHTWTCVSCPAQHNLVTVHLVQGTTLCGPVSEPGSSAICAHMRLHRPYMLLEY